MSKLRLDYFLMRGGLLVKGDEGSELSEGFSVARDYDVMSLNIEGHANLNCIVESFTPRKNNGSQPVPNDFPVIVISESTLPLDIIEEGIALEFEWSKFVGEFNWKPDLEKLIEQQNEYDKEKEAEMQKQFETNQEVYFSGGRNETKYKFGCYTLEKGKCILLYDGGHVVARLDAVNTKSQEEIELEEAKKKQIESIVQDIHSMMINIGNNTAIVIAKMLQDRDHLAEIILPLQDKK